MTKRGRPRTQRESHDFGTAELISKRQKLIGAQRDNWPAPDLSAAESPLGCLLWQGYLHPDYDQAKRMHDAGVTFAGWWVLTHPKTHAQGPLGRLQGGSGSEVDATLAEAALARARGLLGRERQVLDAVINTCVYGRVNLRALEKLRTGLSWLMRARDSERIEVEMVWPPALPA